MTQRQAVMIRELRSCGMGYRAIATQLDLSRDVVRNYCRANHLDGWGEAVQANINRMAEDATVCTYCGKTLVQPSTGRRRRFCSPECRGKWWGQHRELARKNPKALYSFICQCCGKPFVAYANRDRKYCSRECFIDARFHGGVKQQESVELGAEPVATRIC